MPRLISPPRAELGRLRTPLTAGELRVLDFFDLYLADGWEIYVQPHLNGLRPDFVLLHPNAGIAVFEVKDWNLDAFKYFIREVQGVPSLWCENRDGKLFRQKDAPVEKIVRYKDEILSLYCPRLGMQVCEQPKILSVVTAGVVVPTASTERIKGLLRPILEYFKLLGSNEKYYPLAGGDALKVGDLAAVFPWGNCCTSRWMNPQLAQDLRAWLVEPEHSVAQRNPLPLNSRQRELATTRTDTGYRRIRGPAGCGKSLSLAARAAHLSAEGKEVLVVSYNLTLLHYLRDLAVRYPNPRKSIVSGITWLHFHGWCKRVCQEARLEEEYRHLWRDKPGGSLPGEGSDGEPHESLLEQELPLLVGQAIDAGGNAITCYDAILVDEGQDFNLEWWNLLRRVLRPGGEMVLTADRTQDLYARSSRWTDRSLENAGFRGGNWIRLEGSHRFPPDLVRHLRRFAQQYLSANENDLPTAVQSELFESVCLRWLQVSSSRAIEACVQAASELTQAASPAISWADLTLLVRSHEFGLQCVEALKARGVNVAHVFGTSSKEQKRQKVGFWMGDARMKATTIHSFKGWESRAMVVHIGKAQTITEKSIVYVALSRLMRCETGSFLTVVCSAPELETYGRTWPAFESWE